MNMHKRITTIIRTPLIVCFFAVVFGWSSLANAYLIGESNVAIDWDTLNIVESGLSISLFNQQTLTGDYNYLTLTGGGGRVYDWNAHSYSYSDTNRLAQSDASDAGVYTNSWARLDDPGEIHFNTVSLRGTQFSVTGTGTLTISVDYLLSIDAFNTGDPGSSATSRADVWLALSNTDTDQDIFTPVAYAESFYGDGTEIAREWDESLSTFVSSTPNAGPIYGTLTAILAFEDGHEGVFSIRAGTEIDLDMPSQSVPEPASLALMGLGLVGLGFSRRKKVM